MNYVVVDLEMNPLPRKYRLEYGSCRAEIIQIGAVLLDDRYEEQDSYMAYVKPALASGIAGNIQHLTGITMDDIRDAPCFADAWHAFYRWCLSRETDVQVITWSDNDQRQVIQEMALKSYTPSAEETAFLDAWCDFQLEYGQVIGLSQSTSLTNAVMLSGEDFKGHQHDALFDARNTADLVRTVRIPERRAKALGVVIDALEEKPIGASLGDMFDFSALGLK